MWIMLLHLHVDQKLDDDFAVKLNISSRIGVAQYLQFWNLILVLLVLQGEMRRSLSTGSIKNYVQFVVGSVVLVYVCAWGGGVEVDSLKHTRSFLTSSPKSNLKMTN